MFHANVPSHIQHYIVATGHGKGFIAMQLVYTYLLIIIMFYVKVP